MGPRVLALFLLSLILGVTSSSAQSSHGYTVKKLVGPGSPEIGNEVVGTPTRKAYLITNDTVVFLTVPATDTSASNVTCGTDWKIYTVPVQGGPIKPLLTSATRLESAQPANSPTSLCSNFVGWGQNLVFAAIYRDATNSPVGALYSIPLTGGTPTHIVGGSDVLEDGDHISQISAYSAPTPDILLVDLRVTSTVAQFVRQYRRITPTGVEARSTVMSTNISCPGGSGLNIAAGVPSLPNLASDGVIFADAGNWVLGAPFLRAGNSEALSKCEEIIFDTQRDKSFPITSLPGLPSPPLRAPTQFGYLGVRDNKVYFSAWQDQANGFRYSGIFAVDVSTHVATKLITNRDPNIPDMNPSPVPCPGQSNALIHGFFDPTSPAIAGNRLLFSLSQPVQDCATGSTTTHGGSYIYDFDTQKIVRIAERKTLPNVAYVTPLQNFISEKGTIHGVITSVNSSGSTYSITGLDLYGINFGQKVSTLALTAPVTSSYAGQVAITATLSKEDSSAAANATGSIHFFDGATSLGDVALTGTGTATLTLNSFSVGSHNIKAVYDGDANYQGADSAIRTLTVTQGSTSVAVTPGTVRTPYRAAGQLVARVIANPGGTPSGSVVFTSGATTLATVPLDSNLQAALDLSTLPVGTYSIVASYAGDTNFTGSRSSAASVEVGVPDFTITATPPSATIRAGETATFTFTVTPSFGFNQPVSLACSGLPANARCTFSPASVTPSGSPVTSTLTIQTNVVAAAMTPAVTGARVFALAGMFGLPMLVLVRRRRLWRSVALTVLLVGLGGFSGCGGNGASTPTTPTTPVTPTGSSTVTATASAGAGGTARSASISLTIN